MKFFTWNNEKNEKLKKERKVSFEAVIFHVLQGDVLDIVEHPDQTKYKGQRMFILEIEGYAYLVPFIETEHEVFLKTIIPSRRATKTYLRKGRKP